MTTCDWCNEEGTFASHASCVADAMEYVREYHADLDKLKDNLNKMRSTGRGMSADEWHALSSSTLAESQRLKESRGFVLEVEEMLKAVAN